MELYEKFELQGCPECGGPGLLEDDGYSFMVTCMDCGGHTVSIGFKKPEQMEAAAKSVADLWNMGKIISSSPGE